MGERTFPRLIKSKTGLIISLCVILIAAAAAVYPLLRGQTAKELYLKAESKNIVRYFDMIKEGYRGFREEFGPYENERSRIRREFTADIKADSGQQIFDLIGNAKLVFDTLRDPVQKTASTTVSLLLEKAPLLDAEFFTEEGRLGFTVPVFTPDRYFTVDTDKIDQVYERFGIPVRPKRFAGPEAVYETVVFSEEDWDDTFNAYGEMLKSALRDEDVRFDGEAETEDGKAKGRKVIVELDSARTGALISELAEKAAGDEALKALTYGNLAGLSALIGDMGVYQALDYLDETGIFVPNAFIKAFINEISEAADETVLTEKIASIAAADYPGGIRMELIIDGKGDIVQRSVKLSYTREDGSGGAVDYLSGTGDSRRNVFKNGYLSINISDEKGEIATENGVRLSTERQADNGAGRVDFSFENQVNGAREFALELGFNLDSAQDGQTGAVNNTVAYTAEIRGKADEIRDLMTGEIKTSVKSNDKTRNKNTAANITLIAEMQSLGLDKTEIGLNAVTDRRLGIEAFSLPDTSGKKLTDLSSATQAELEQVGRELMASMGAFYISNKPLVDALGGANE